MNRYILHLENPGQNWENYSPIGNGSCGMMISGGVMKDILTLNEETIWSENAAGKALENLSEKIAHIRELFIEEKPFEATEWISEQIGEYPRIRSYEYAGRLLISLHEDDVCTEYSRDLDLQNGVCTVSYTKDGASYKREYFASMTNGLLCAKYTASTKFDAKIAYERENIICASYSDSGIKCIAETAEGGHKFALEVKVLTDGVCCVTADALSVQDASYIETYTAISTAFKLGDYETAAEEMLRETYRGWDTLLTENKEIFSAYMSRSDITLNGDPTLENMPVDQRLERLKNDSSAQDPSLIALYWRFGKYMLVASSAGLATLPANLQGVWSDGLESPWNADYHTNINLQMNYWHAEQANISDCTKPLFRYMNEFLLPGGKKAAKDIYNTRGMVVHHLSDIYEFAAIADGPWGIWPQGGTWLAYHLWEHFLYTRDEKFLRDTAYEFIRECALFWIDNLFEGKDGFLHTGPSASPENVFYVGDPAVDSRTACATISPTMDVEIVGGLLDFYCELENILGLDPNTAKTAKEKREKMLPLRVGKYGQLMEWLHDYEEFEPGHRHISHAFALYPAAQINRNTPELYKAIEVTLDRRLASGGGHTGWSRAWLINLFARFRNGEKTYENIRALLTKSTLPNLFDTHPPFQIDGNFGGAAGIGEMLMQSHEECISLLPAVSKMLPEGSFRGLRARGGLEVSAEWKAGRITQLEISSDFPHDVTVELENGERISVYAEGKTVITR